MKASIAVLATLMAAFVLSQTAPPNQQVLFEKALVLEEAHGKLQEAMALYQKIIDESNDNALAAQAQLRIGICHQKLGHKEAQSAFQKVIDNYPDQVETIRLAQEQLSLLVRAQGVLDNKNQEPAIRQVWSGPGVDMSGAPSPDGRYLSFVDWSTGDLAIRDLETGKNRRLTNKGTWDESDEEAGFSRWSPKGDQIAYQWCEREGHPVEICVVGLDGSEPRILYSSNEYEWAELYDWSPDAKQILASLPGTQLSLISVADGSIRALKTGKKTTWRNLRARFSPDGRYIVYHAPQAVNSLERDIFVLSLDGDREIPLVVHPADDSLIGWAPNGKWVLFASDRTGSLCIWAVPVAEGKPQGSPKIIKTGSRNYRPLGFARDGRFFFGEKSAASDVYTIKLDPASGKVLSPPEKSINRFEGYNSRPRYSPDGKYLAYRSNLRTRKVLLCIQSLETGNDREYYSEFKRFGIRVVGRPRWSPDSQSILVYGLRDSGPGVGIYRLSVQTGDVTPIVQSIEGFGVNVEWHPDGKSIIYMRSDNTSDLAYILRSELEGGTEKTIYKYPASENLEIAVSPDGRWLSTIHRISKTERILRISALSGGVSRELVRFKTEDGGLPYRHAWSADGKYILFHRKRINARTWDLWRVSTEGGAEPQKLDVSMPWVIDHLTAHPDNRTFAFTSNVSVVDPSIWVMENLPLFAK